MHAHEDLDPELAKVGEAAANVPYEGPPADLVSRTLARISSGVIPVKRVFWMLRPITHPLARIAAAALIIFAFAPMLDINLADPLGSRIEARIIGSKTAAHIEGLLDRVLTSQGNSYSQDDLDSVMGIRRPNFVPVRRVSVSSSRRNGA